MRKVGFGVIGCGVISTAYLKAAERFANLFNVFPTLLSRDHEHFGVTDHRGSYGRIFDDVVLLSDGQDVAPELPHLAVVFLDHLGTSGNIKRARGFFEDGELRD